MKGWTGQVPRILVVGWGFLGAAIGMSLSDHGVDVCGLTRSETSRTHAAHLRGIHISIGDAGNQKTIESSMRGVDHVVYVAGGLDPPSAALRPLEDAVGTLSPLLATLETTRSFDHVSLTYISSGGAVYGNPIHTLATEADIPRPVSSYGVSRFAGEVYSQMYAATFGITAQIVRCANVYGPGQSHARPQGAVAVFLHRIAAGLTISVVGNGRSVRDYVYIADVTTALARLVLDRVDCGVVNLGSGVGHTVTELLAVVSNTVGRAPVVEFAPRRSHDVDAIVLDISKLRSLIPYEPTALEDGVRATWERLGAEEGLDTEAGFL
ncbi:MAG: NAD-dependent epimerase/dehydratase family protein [Candidatus Dormiibacterota bacterium]